MDKIETVGVVLALIAVYGRTLRDRRGEPALSIVINIVCTIGFLIGRMLLVVRWL